jgi:hypothetical protein
MFRHVIWQKLADVSEVLTASIIKTIIDSIYQTTRHNSQKTAILKIICVSDRRGNKNKHRLTEKSGKVFCKLV